MLDCGMHMGFSDHRRFPDFTYISRSGGFDQMIDCVIISHFHLDHVGALPHFTEICGYSGPIYMTYPTRAICPILLEDMRRIMVDRKGDMQFFTSEDIRNCMRKVTAVDLHQTTWVNPRLSIKALHAGHVVGAAMFLVQVGEDSILYTGDFNMTPDRHLGAARVEKFRPTLLITETTYATTVRKSRRAREREFLQQVHECVKKGGKALIPVFSLGRAQELCILIEDYWDRTDDLRGTVPVYFSAGLAEHATQYYSLFINWTNERMKRASIDRNVFNFEHIKVYQPQLVDDPGPMVLFASPGMLHAGTSLDVFKKWCGSPDNMVILPGYCVAGTVGARVLAGQKTIEIDRFTTLNVRMTVKNLSFSAHADSKGIMQLIRTCEPKYVMLVHGEATKMSILKERIHKELKIPCIDPANGETVYMDSAGYSRCLISLPLASSAWRRSCMLLNHKLQASSVKLGLATDESEAHPKPVKRAKLRKFGGGHPPEAAGHHEARLPQNLIGDIHGVLRYLTPPTSQPAAHLPNGGQGSIKLLGSCDVTGSSVFNLGKMVTVHRLKCAISADSAFGTSVLDDSFSPGTAPPNHRYLLLDRPDTWSVDGAHGKVKHATLNEIALALATTFPDYYLNRDPSDSSTSLRPWDGRTVPMEPEKGSPAVQAIRVGFADPPELAVTIEWPGFLEYTAWEVVCLVENIVR